MVLRVTYRLTHVGSIASHDAKKHHIRDTCEVIEPPARSLVTVASLSAHRIVTTAFMPPHVASG